MPVRSRIKDSIFSLTVKQNWTTRKSLWQVGHKQFLVSCAGALGNMAAGLFSS